MINLLPPDSSRQLRAARHNAIIMRFFVSGGISLGLIVLVYAVTFALMKSTEISSDQSSTVNQQKIESFRNTEAAAKQFTADLTLAKTIFDSELSYTTALEKIASALPPGAVLTTLALSPTTPGQSTSLLVLAKSQSAALAVKESLQKNNIATGITIASISEEAASAPADGGQAAPSEYPVALNLNLTFDAAIFKPEVKNE